MIPWNGKYFHTANLSAEFCRSYFGPDAEVSKEVQNVIRFCAIIQALKNRLIHLLGGFEGAIAIPNDILVPEMKIGREPNIWQVFPRAPVNLANPNGAN